MNFFRNPEKKQIFMFVCDALLFLTQKKTEIWAKIMSLGTLPRDRAQSTNLAIIIFNG